MKLPSRFQIDDTVSLNTSGNADMPVATAKVVAVTFTAGKVYYDLALPFNEGEFGTTYYPVMQRVDSILVSEPT